MLRIIEELVYAYKSLFWKFKNFTRLYPRISRYVIFLPVTLMEVTFSTINTIFSVFISFTALIIRYYFGLNAAKFYAAAAHIVMSILMIIPTEFAISFMQTVLLSGATLLFGPAGTQAMSFVMQGSALMVQVLMTIIIRDPRFLLYEPLSSISFMQAVLFNAMLYLSSYDILSRRLESADFFEEDNVRINNEWRLHSIITKSGPMLFLMSNFAPLIGVFIAVSATVGQVGLDLYVRFAESIDLALRRRKMRADNPQLSAEQIEALIQQQLESSRQVSAQDRIAQIFAADQNRIHYALNNLEATTHHQVLPMITARERQSVIDYENVLAAATRITNNYTTSEISEAEMLAAKQQFAQQTENIVNIIPREFLAKISAYNIKQEEVEALAQNLDQIDSEQQPQEYLVRLRLVQSAKSQAYEIKSAIESESAAVKLKLQLQTNYNKYAPNNFWNINADKVRDIESSNPELVSELLGQLMVIPGYVEQRNAAGRVVATFKMDLLEFLDLLVNNGSHPLTRKGLTMQDFVFDYKAFKQIQAIKAAVASTEDLDSYSEENNKQLFLFDRIRNAANSVYDCVANAPNYAKDYVRQSKFNNNPSPRDAEMHFRILPQVPRLFL